MTTSRRPPEFHRLVGPVRLTSTARLQRHGHARHVSNRIERPQQQQGGGLQRHARRLWLRLRCARASAEMLLSWRAAKPHHLGYVAGSSHFRTETGGAWKVHARTRGSVAAPYAVTMHRSSRYENDTANHMFQSRVRCVSRHATVGVVPVWCCCSCAARVWGMRYLGDWGRVMTC